MTREQLAREIYNSAYLTGTFKLRSGQMASEYFDKYRFEAQPKILRQIARQLLPLIPTNCEVLAGLEMGGLPIATALSLESGIPCAFIRKQAKTYGTCQFAEGANIQNKNICLIEDVITTGGQVLVSTNDLRNVGAHVHHVLCVIHRNPEQLDAFKNAGLHLKSLFTMQELLLTDRK